MKFKKILSFPFNWESVARLEVGMFHAESMVIEWAKEGRNEPLGEWKILSGNCMK